jgi:hypothetical protein
MATPTTLPATFVAGNVLTAAQMNNLRGAFRVLQVVQGGRSTAFSTTSVTMVDVTDVTLSITPSATSSKILLLLTGGSANSGNNINSFNVLRGATILSASGSGVTFNAYYGATTTLDLHHFAWSFLDSPNTTSATTYKLQMSVGAGTGYVNRRASGTDSTTSTYLTALEISA